MSREAGDDAAPPPLRVAFGRPHAGWIDIEVAPLANGWRVSATHLTSHFDEMLRWLEAILDGADGARWTVDGETAVTHFIYLGETGHLVGDAARPGLLAFQSSIYEPPRLCGFHAVDRPALVRTFYEAFRTYAATDYDPDEWEGYDDETGSGWQGEPLRVMRSMTIEAALRAGDNVQPELKLRFPRGRP